MPPNYKMKKNTTIAHPPSFDRMYAANRGRKQMEDAATRQHRTHRFSCSALAGTSSSLGEESSFTFLSFVGIVRLLKGGVGPAETARSLVVVVVCCLLFVVVVISCGRLQIFSARGFARFSLPGLTASRQAQ
jgi:hypothetical protein